MVDADRVIAAGIPFTEFDVLFSAAVGAGLLVAAVGARVAISRRRRPALRRLPVRQVADAEQQRAAAGG
jgi:hypothetical protein